MAKSSLSLQPLKIILAIIDMRIVINPKYSHVTEFIHQLAQPGWFASPENGTVLHAGRNSVKMFEVNDLKLVVKSYGHLSFVNKLIYGRLRKSKACRAYEFAARLLNLGISTPENVAYIEKRSKGVLSESYFVCLYTDYNSIPQSFRNIEAGSDEFNQIIPLLDSLTSFLYKIHEAGVIHNDLNFTNILYTKENEYKFTLIDINRMKFKNRLSIEERLYNMRRISLSIPAHAHILKQYAKIIGMDPDTMERFGLGLRKRFEQKREKNARVKRLIRGHNK